MFVYYYYYFNYDLVGGRWGGGGRGGGSKRQMAKNPINFFTIHCPMSTLESGRRFWFPKFLRVAARTGCVHSECTQFAKKHKGQAGKALLLPRASSPCRSVAAEMPLAATGTATWRGRGAVRMCRCYYYMHMFYIHIPEPSRRRERRQDPPCAHTPNTHTHTQSQVHSVKRANQ